MGASRSGRSSAKQRAFVLDALLENTETQLAFLDLDFRFVWVNSAYARGSGHTREELLGRGHFDLFPNPENQAVFERVRDTGEAVRYRAKPLEYADGPLRGVTYWDWTLCRETGTEGAPAGLVLSLEDVTERTRAQDALRDGLAMLEEAETVAGMGSFRWDRRSDSLTCSQNMYALAGIDASQAAGRLAEAVADRVHPEDRQAVRQQIEQMIDRREAWPMEFRLVRPDGDVRWVRSVSRFVFDRRGEVTGCVGVQQDITGEREARQEQEATVRLLALANARNSLHDFMRATTTLLREWSGCEAVGIRLRAGQDYPYFETRGFTPEFLEAEAQLCACDREGEPLRDSQGKPMLEGLCGAVLRGGFESPQPFLTDAGSFWTNSTSDLLASGDKVGLPAQLRNRCHREGYESLALVPIRAAGETYGLLQLSDRRKGRFRRERIEFFERLAGSIAAGLSQRAAEDQLLEREARHRAVLETQADGFWIADLTGKILEVNETYARRSGYSQEELLSMRISDLQGGAPNAEDHIRRIAREGHELFESVHRAKDGTLIPVEVSASYWPIDGGRIFAFLRDISQRKRSEVLLRARLDLSELAVHGTVDDVLQHALDAAELFTGSSIGFFHFVDEEERRLTLQTWSSGTLHNMCTAEGKGSHYPVDEAGVWADAVRSRRPVLHNDYAALSHRKGLPPGHAPVVRELVVPILIGGKVVAVVGVGNKSTAYTDDDVEPVRELASMAMDLVGRKWAEQKLERLYEQTRRDAQIKARLLMEVNHRVKNNLLSLLGMLLVERRLSPPEALPQVVSVTERVTRRIRGLLAAHDMLSKSEWAPVRVTDLAEQVLYGALGSIGAEGQVFLEIPPSEDVVSPRQVASLALVLNELATNTVKHVLPEPGQRRIAIHVAREEGYLTVQYRDDGPGYPEQALRGEGGGVGLRLIREISEGTLRGVLSLANQGGAVARIRIKVEEPEKD